MIDLRAEITQHDRLTGDTCLMAFRAPEIASLAGPGQFIMVRVAEGPDPLLRRPFSICRTTDRKTFSILYRVVGRGTEILAQARPGEALSILGPLGSGFQLPEPGTRTLLVAGGIGLAPLAFLFHALGPAETEILLGFRSKDEAIPLAPLGLDGASISLATDDGSAGHKGLVTDLLHGRLAGMGGAGARVYACGPNPMLRTVVALTQKTGTPCQVSLEAFMACGLGACQGCAVGASPGQGREYFHVCRDGPVFDAAAVNWGRR
jgi:dihydroorotate dehydrogenase electron transfer subunit